MKKIIFIVQIFFISALFAQDTGIVFGLVIDQHNSDPLIGANIVILGTCFGSAADLNGEYQISALPPGDYLIKASSLGYLTSEKIIIVLPGERLEVDFALKNTALEAVPDVVIAAEKLVEGGSVSDVALSSRQIQSKDGLLEDPVKIVQTMPGIASMGDPFSPGQLYVRGGAPEENLFLLDWAKVYFPWFVGGMKSVFNSQIISDIELLTGGFPPKYGNCLSSVLSVTTRDGNREKFAGGCNIGIMTSQGLIEGPINDRSSFLISARRTYLDLIMGEQEDFPVPSFYDYSIKLKYDLSARHNLDFTLFQSHEKYDFASDDPDAGIPPYMDMDMRANTQTLELNSIFNVILFSKFAFTHSYIASRVKAGSVYDVHSIPELFSLREDITYTPNSRHEVKTGFEFSYNDYFMASTMPLDPSDTYTSWDSTGMPRDSYNFQGQYNLGGVYVQDSYTVVDALTLTGGLRSDYDFENDNMDIAPRLSARYELSRQSAFRIAWGDYRMFKDRMFLQMNNNLESDKAIHYIIGFDHNFSRTFSGWVEVYYKDYSNLATVDSAGVFSDDGTGSSQGVEVFLQKKAGALTGWFNISLSEAKRREYLDMKEFTFDYNQPVIANLVMEYKFPRDQRWIPDVIGLNFRYYIGRPFTPTVAAEDDGSGNYILVMGETNSERYGDFHALSFRCEWQFPVFKTAEGKFFLEAWNLYDRENEMGVNYSYGSQYPNGVEKRPYYSTPFLLGGGIGIYF